MDASRQCHQEVNSSDESSCFDDELLANSNLKRYNNVAKERANQIWGGEAPIHDNSKANISKLRPPTFVEAHELVQNETRKAIKIGRNHDPRSYKLPGKQTSRVTDKRDHMSMESTRLRVTETKKSTPWVTACTIDESGEDSEVEYMGTIPGTALVVDQSLARREPRMEIPTEGQSDHDVFEETRKVESSDHKRLRATSKRKCLFSSPTLKDAPSPETTHDELFTSSDVDFVCFQTVERVDCNEDTSKKRISEMRRYGIPFIITGHLTWPPFVSRWVHDEGPVKSPGTKRLVIENLIADIGDEDVPIAETNYDERNPVNSVMKAADFLKNHWTNNSDCSHKQLSRDDQLYMQQWQFTTSPVAKFLCGDDDCVPPDVLHEDLVSHWLNDGGNPYQYLFMGSAGTTSKLHKDPGGLDILIAPIVGEKECVLVHRDDEKYLYGCRVKLDKIDLNRFPLIACARLWKTMVKPGEILVMPHDTYHLCRNVTSCLSYHRLHLDHVNLPGFLASFFKQDSGESVDHEAIIWNCAHNLCQKVDDYVKESRSPEDDDSISFDRGASVDAFVLALRSLQPICMQLMRSFQEFGSSPPLRFSRDSWKDHSRTIDITLFHYRYRNDRNPRRFKPMTLQGAVESDESSDEQEEMIEYRGKWCIEAELQVLLDAMNSLPPCNEDEEGLVMSDGVSIELRNMLEVRLPEVNRRATGTVSCIREMHALYVSYDKLPPEFDEFLPCSAVLGSASSSVLSASSTALRPAIGGNQNVRCMPSSGSRKVRSKL